jgi:NADPH:quinone reductase-like Zn-dependent oxidoreductase
MAFYPGSLTTNWVVPAEPVLRIPNNLSFEEAATVPICFATVIHSLIDLGRLSRGQSVLIHSACGGVGLTAIQVCQMLGAEMYLTVGSARKVDYLVETFGIPRSRIFNSRDSSFVEGVMRETGGRGVDLVLNSLSGELLHESWRCVAKYGAMMELGKRDILGSGRLNMINFQDNKSYHGVDLNSLGLERPAQLRE